MNVTIATAPCSWGVWYGDGTPSGTPWEVFLDQASQGGYKALELGPVGYLPSDDAELKAELAARGLDVCAGTCCYRFDQYGSFEDFKPQVDELCKRLVSLGAKYVVTMDESDVGAHSEKKAGFSPAEWDAFFAKIGKMAEFTKSEYGIDVVYHPHIRSMIETDQEIIQLMERTGVDLCFDTGHHAYVNGGTDMNDRSALDFMERYASKIPYLHFKNVDSKIRRKVIAENLTSDQAFDMDVMCDLADGIINFNDLKATLQKIDFNGIAVIEQDMPRATTQQAFDAAVRNLEFLRSIGIIS